MKKNDDNPVDRIKEQLEILKLFRAKEVIDDILSEAARDNMPASRVMEQLLSAEVAALIKRRSNGGSANQSCRNESCLPIMILTFKPGWTNNRLWSLPPLALLSESKG